MAGNLTRIKNNQVTDAAAGNTQVGINAGTKVQNYSITAGKIANNLTYGSDLTITGNLTVQGTTTAVNTVNTVIQDPLLVLADGQTSGSPAVDIGYVGLRGSQNSAAFVWKESAGEFVTALTTTDVGGTNLSNTTITVSSYANLHSGNTIHQGTTSLIGNLIGAVNATATITGGNLATPGTASATGTVTGGNLATGGTASATGNITGGNVLTGGVVSAAGNIIANPASYFIGNGSQLTGVAASSAGFPVSLGTTNISAISSGNIYATVAGTPNVVVWATTGSYISGLSSVTGNVIGGNLVTAGTASATGNITGGNVLTGGLISATGAITGASTISATGTVTGGNLATGGTASATGNITGGNVLTGGLISATATITGGNIATGGTASATGNITGGNVLTGGLISATGNISGANVNATGNIVPTANVTYNLGSPTAQWKSLYVSGNTIYMANLQLQQPSGQANTLQLTGADGSTLGGINISTLSATGNITGGNLNTGGQVSATANITGGNILTSGLMSSTGNATHGNVLTGGLVSATANVTGGNILTGGLISATGNITGVANISGGNLLTGGLISATATITGGNLATGGTASATGNIDGGNLRTAGLVTATGNVVGNSLVTGGRVYSAGAMTITNGTGNINLSPTGNIVLNNNYINSIALTPVQDQDVASKYYVDTMVSTQLTYHQPVVAATVANSATTTGGTVTYTQPNGVSNGIGAYLQTTGSWNLVDTANVQTANTRILIKDEGNAVWNGVYGWANSTTIVRTLDTDTYGPQNTTDLSINDYFFVTSGNVNKGSAFVVDSPSGTITFGSSNISFALFSSSQTYTAGNGISIAGTVINARVDNTTTAFDGSQNIIVKAGAQLTTPNIGAATGTSLSVTGGVTATTTITGGNLATGGTTSATGTITGGNIATGGTVSATGNITGNYYFGNGSQLTGVSASTSGFPVIAGTSNIAAATNGNVAVTVGGISNVLTVTTTGIVTSGTSSVSGNITGANINTAGLVVATGNIAGGNVLTGGLISATATITGGNLATGGTASATGNITGGNVLTGGLISAAGAITGASTVSATGTVTGGNLATGGTASATGTITGGNLATGGTASATGNITGGNVLTGGLISAAGNIIANPASYFIGNGSQLTGVAASSAGFPISSGTSNISAISSGNIYVGVGGTPNVVVWATTGSYISGLSSVTGNITGGNVLTGGLVSATATITGGNLATGGTASATGNITGGNLLTGGLVSATATITGGNIATGGTVSATGAITGASTISATGTVTGGNIATGGTASATGNITGGNVLTGGLVSATATITGGNLATGGTASATGNITGGNLLTGGQVSATGNVTGGNIVITGNAINMTAAGGTLIHNSANANTNFAVNGTAANVFFVNAATNSVSFGSSTQTTNAVAAFNTTTSVLMPVGNTAQRPGTGVTGMMRFNTTGNYLEIFDNTKWIAVAAENYTVIADEQFSGDGTTTAFTLSSNAQTTNSCLVSINGVVQVPVTAYAVSGTTMTFTEAPAAGDLIDVREITTTTSISSISNSSGNASIYVNDQTSNVSVTGNLVASGTIFAQTLNITTTESITGNIIGGNVNTVGQVSATGNITGNYFIGNGSQLTGLSASKIFNGTSEANIGSSGGNVTFTVGGTAIAGISTAGIYNAQANGVGNIGSSSTYFNTVFAKATSAQYADLAEMYAGDAAYEPGTVVDFGGDQEITISTKDMSRAVAGVVSTNPSYLMNSGQAGDNVVAVALTGRVPTKVTGPVSKGDLMVSNGDGTARAEESPAVGTIIGKALADFNGDVGVIEVVVGRF
jgi:hypothetical protein